MEIRYEVLNNLIKVPNGSPPVFLAQITIANKGSTAIKHGNWSVYFCSIRMLESRYLKHNPSGYVIPGNSGIRFTHIDGCLVKFETTSDFKEIAAGDSLTFKFKANAWSVARTDVMPRWFITAEGLSPRVIKNTNDEELKLVGNFDTKEKWKRSTKDIYNPYTPEQRYKKDFVSDLMGATYDVIPTPVSVTLDEESGVKITSQWTVYIQAGLENEAAPLEGMSYRVRTES